ncbi:MAG: adenylosuccinate synthetase, partial [Lewinella sp.]
MKTACVIGLGYGDEGKGATTDALVSQSERPLVIRFSGGHQAGHTVTDATGRRHVFSNFGAGSLSGAPTYWSRYCSFHPPGFARERDALLALDVEPMLFVDGRCPVTTPYDLLHNRAMESQQQHGSCGLGFGATVGRQEGPHKIHVGDLLDEFVAEQKLRSVALYYEKAGAAFDQGMLQAALDDFHASLTIVRKHLRIVAERSFFADIDQSYTDLIFEGSQGILLDQEFGYFPHVTRAYTTSRTAVRLCERYDLPLPKVYYITRCYQTRHGTGPLTNEDLPPPALRPTPEETNVYNPWQGHQRRTLLDLDQLRYALACDTHYAAGLGRALVVTCRDQLSGPLLVTEGGEIHERSITEIGRRLRLTIWERP